MKELKKKAQFYLLTAIILSLIAFMISETASKTMASNNEQRTLYNNFISEAPIVINNAAYEGRNVTQSISDFTAKYVYYAGTKNINLSMFYIFVNGDSMLLSNMLGEDVNVTSAAGERTISSRQDLSMQRYSRVKVELAGVDYPFSISDEQFQMKVIFRTKDDNNNTEVYVYG